MTAFIFKFQAPFPCNGFEQEQEIFPCVKMSRLAQVAFPASYSVLWEVLSLGVEQWGHEADC